MPNRFADDGKTTLEAKFEAQKLTFGPMMFQAARVLRNCGALEFLKDRGREGATAEELHAAVPSLTEYAARLLLEAGLAGGMLVLEDERFVITKTGYLILADPMTRVNMDFVHDVCYRGMFHLDEAIAEQRPAGLATLGAWKTVYEGLSQLPDDIRESWFAFDHFYSDGVFKAALPRVFAHRPRRVLDVGGNTGKFATECCAFDGDVEITICDLPGQLAVALANVGERGLSARVTGHPIDFLDPDQVLPDGHDAIWMSQFLDCFGEAEVISILRRARAVMNEDVRLHVLETFWDRQVHEAARYAVINTSLYFTAIANGNSKMYHSGRMKHCLAEAGLTIESEVPNIGLSHTLLTCRVA